MQRWCKIYKFASSSQLVWRMKNLQHNRCTSPKIFLRHSFVTTFNPSTNSFSHSFMCVMSHKTRFLLFFHPSSFFPRLSLSPSPPTTASKKWIKICYIHILCMQTFHIRLCHKTRIFFSPASSFEGGNMNSFFPFALHLFDMNSKNIRNELLI